MTSILLVLMQWNCSELTRMGNEAKFQQKKQKFDVQGTPLKTGFHGERTG